MKVTRFDGTDARRVLTGLITDDNVVRRVASRWKAEGLFGSRWENIIAGWCVDHSRKYGKAPGRDIETIFRATTLSNADEIEAIEKLLVGLSDSYEANGSAPASEYLIDLAGRLFKRTDLKRRAEAALADLERGDLGTAEQRLTEYRGIEFGPGAMDVPDADIDYWLQVFDDEEAQSLIAMPAGLGTFWDNELCRDAFVAYMASEKRGKSWWLLDLTARAFRQRRRVAFFSVGDMSRNQVGRRLGRRLLNAPKYNGTYKIPVAWPDANNAPDIEEQELAAVGPASAYAAANRMSQGRGNLRVVCYSARTIDALGIEGVLKGWAEEGWVADVVVIDYADILGPPAGVADSREQINVNWINLRRMSSELHCCVITATQANAKSYTVPLLGPQHFSEDKRKYAHVTAMVGINQMPDEKKLGIYRLNWLQRREGMSDVGNAVSVAGNLDVGCPAMIVRGMT